MFHPSAATDTLQGRAIQKINDVWGQDKHRGWDNYKNIGIPVCKKKYRPFEFQIKKKNKLGGGVEISVWRMYGCAAHSNIRKALIERHGERKGWEPFGQWSLGKAKAAAKRESARLNGELYNSSTCLSVSSSSSSPSSGYDSSRSSSSSSEDENVPLCLFEESKQQQPWQTLCSNGSCNWKIKGKFDDICSEIEDERSKKVV
mmetsp:Transcript_8028/g.14069  ORF Transcript_8028/g.14069 Transcript_8028/m.14069 type:complete len:202 (-) Transcript_8028:395-1000(-)